MLWDSFTYSGYQVIAAVVVCIIFYMNKAFNKLIYVWKSNKLRFFSVTLFKNLCVKLSGLSGSLYLINLKKWRKGKNNAISNQN